MAATGFAVYSFFGNHALESGGVSITQAQTASFTAVILLHMGYLVTARLVYDSAFTFSPLSNKLVLAGIAASIATLLIIIYVPLFQVIFKTEVFPSNWWPWVVLAVLPGFIVIETEKWIQKRLKRTRYEG